MTRVETDQSVVAGMRMPGFDDRVAVVTGAARGIGRAIAEALHEQGARVAALDVRLPDDRPEADGRGIRYLACDVSDEHAVDDAFTTIERELGPVSVLVNNAGILRASPIEDVTLDEWRLTLDVNLTGSFLCCRRALPGMREAGYGRVVCIGSSAGKTGGYKHLTSYAASKAALMSLARSVATEYAAFGITSNAIAPAAIDTEMIVGLTGFEDKIPVGRLGTPADIAAAVVFLCSAAAGFVTAEVMDVNGGFLID